MTKQSVDHALERVPVGGREFSEYRRYSSAEQYDQILARARGLKGLRIVEINSTPKGGGVATMLHSIIPTLQSLSLDVRGTA